jgi:putative transposase
MGRIRPSALRDRIFSMRMGFLMKHLNLLIATLIPVKLVFACLVICDVCPGLGIISATFCKCRYKFGSMDTSMIARIREPAKENAHLKKMYIEEIL